MLNVGVSKNGSRTNSRHGPSGASHYWFLTQYCSAPGMLLVACRVESCGLRTVSRVDDRDRSGVAQENSRPRAAEIAAASLSSVGAQYS